MGASSADATAQLITVRGEISAQTPLIVTCEHADRYIPDWVGTAPNERDQHLLETHNGYDIGVLGVADALINGLGAVGVFANFSRLICDTNRDWYDPSCIRLDAEGSLLGFNQQLSPAERSRRKRDCYDAYHALVEDTLSDRQQYGGQYWLLSLHSFTRQFEGEVREMEIGVLYDQYINLATEFARGFREAGFVTALNQPYSGYEGLIYSVAWHGNRHRLPYLELEVRQDLIDTPEKAVKMGERLVPLFRQLDVFKIVRKPNR